MKKFYGFFDNGKYKVGCNGGTIYVYDQNENELAKFKGFSCTYKGAFRPGTNVFVAKSIVDHLLVFDLDKLSLVKKIKFSRVEGAQDEGFAFSSTGDLFYNIEKPVISYRTQLTIYDGSTFEKVAECLNDDENMVLRHVEAQEDGVYLFGYVKARSILDCYSFAAKLSDYKLTDIRKIKSHAYDVPVIWDSWFHDTDYRYLLEYKNWELHGFSEKEAQSHECLMLKPEPPKVSIKKIWELNA